MSESSRIILAFDTAMAGCSVSIVDRDKARTFAASESMARGQAERLVPMIDEIIVEAGIDYAAIDLIAVTTGPGAFTGLRIALSAARALALALQKPLVGVTTLDVIARQFFQKEKLDAGEALAVILETKRQDFYIQIFDATGAALSDPAALSAEKIRDDGGARKTVIIGDASGRLVEVLGGLPENWRVIKGYDLPDPAVLAALAAETFKAQGAHRPEPLYLREADVSMPKKKQRAIISD